MVHGLESKNTSISILDVDCNIIYESSKNEHNQTIPLEDLEKLADKFQSIKATFKITIIDSWVTALTSVPIIISNKSYLMEFKQLISKSTQHNIKSHYLDDMSIHKMKEMAITDSLTKLYNRRYIDERLPIDMQSSFELDEPLSVLFIDIDYFKRINDKNGHAAGDQVLQELAWLLQTQLCQKNGWIARYGGDEILVCLPGCHKEAAKRIANQFRIAIKNNKFYIEGKKVEITCSIGVETILRDSGINAISDLLILADKNLYRAKNEGRNKVI